MSITSDHSPGMSGLRTRSRSVVGVVALALVALLGAFFVITAQSARAAEAPVNLRTASSFAVLALPVVALAAFAVAWASDRVEAPPPLAAGRRLVPLVPPPQG